MKIIFETPVLRDESKFWKGQVVTHGKEIFKQTETWRLLKDGSESKRLLSKPYRVTGKNNGRSNATTPREQAISEVTSMMQKQIDKGYVEPGQKTKILPLPMLAHKFSDRSSGMKFPAYVPVSYTHLTLPTSDLV